MKGSHKVVVSTKRLKYEFEIRRNITIIRGDSATGKTTLVELIQDFVNNPTSPVELICDKTCYVLQGSFWKEQLKAMTDSIIFIDEGNDFVKSTEFASIIQNTDNYYVIVTREALPSLPYSIEEIYGIKTSGKYGSLKQSYHEFYQLYGKETFNTKVIPDIVLTEDSNSGYQFFKSICDENRIKCQSMNGKSNTVNCLEKNRGKKILVIADGAAFGPEIDKAMAVAKRQKNIVLYLPESFEWLILSSNILKINIIKQILNEPSSFVESRDYFSWKRFFTDLLIKETQNTYLTYTKSKLNQNYLNENNKKLIIKKIKSR